MEVELAEAEADDAALLARRTAEAFRDVHARHAREVFLYARLLAGDDALAEDLTQEAFLRLFECDPSRLGASARGFLVTVVRNRLRDERRRREVRRRAAPMLVARADASPARSASDVALALEALPREQREVVALHVWGGFTFAAIAGIVEAPEGTVLSRYRYALRKLGALL